MKIVFALISGTLFGFGLALSGMTDPAKVVGFLDITGAWDPSLGFVMGCALLVSLPAFQLARRRHNARPWFADGFVWPSVKSIDWRLLAGAALFGIGWGVTGLCPGPALASLISGTPLIIGFVLAMLTGMWLHDRVLVQH
ncbi:MAG TPA: DUF6691 family protein [Solimonas sp.]